MEIDKQAVMTETKASTFDNIFKTVLNSSIYYATTAKKTKTLMKSLVPYLSMIILMCISNNQFHYIVETFSMSQEKTQMKFSRAIDDLTHKY